MTFAHRYVGADSLPARLSEFDVEQYFTLTKADVSALCEWFRADRRVPAADPWTASPSFRRTSCVLSATPWARPR